MPKLLLILLKRPSIFTSSQLDKLADVFVNIGTLFFGAGVVPYLIPGLDKPSLSMLVSGLGLSVISWFFALLFAGRIRR